MKDRISVGQASLNGRPHALYRFYDGSDVLLYVGITMNVAQRMSRHSAEKPWWTSVHNITMQHFNSRAEAQKAEREAIRTEQPLYNVEHNAFVESPKRVHSSIEDFAQDIMTQLLVNESEREKYLREAREYELEPDEEPMADSIEAIAAMRAVCDSSGALFAYRHSANKLFHELPGDTFKTFRDQVIEDFRIQGWEVSEDDLNAAVIHQVAGYLAQTYLDSFGAAEAAEWLACIQTLWAAADESEGPHFTIKAAEYARVFKSERKHLDGLCAGDGEHGAACPQRSYFSIKSLNCHACEGECEGHDGLCGKHLVIALDGKLLRRSTREPILVAAYKEPGSSWIAVESKA